MQNIPEFMTGAVTPNPGRRHPQLLVSPTQMTPEQWAWVLDSDYDVYVAEVTDTDGQVVTRWVGNQDWEHGAESYLTRHPLGRRGGIHATDPRTHTVTVWATPDRNEPTDTIRWTPTMQADMDERRAAEARKHADRLDRIARASREQANNPTPDTPAEEPIAKWEMALLNGEA